MTENSQSQVLTQEQTQIVQLLITMENLSISINELKDVVSKVNHKFNELNNRITRIESHLEFSAGRFESIDRQLGALSNKIEKIEEELDEVKVRPAIDAKAAQDKLIVGVMSAFAAGLVAIIVSKLFGTN